MAQQKQSPSRCEDWQTMMVTGLTGLGFTATAATNALTLYKNYDGQILQTNQYLKQIKIYNNIKEAATTLGIDFSQELSKDKIQEICTNEEHCSFLNKIWGYCVSSNDSFGGSESYIMDDNCVIHDPQEIEDKLNHLKESYGELCATCSPEHIKQEATAMLQRNNTYHYIQLALAFVNISVGIHEFSKNIKSFDAKVAQLSEIKRKYIDPALQMYDSILQSLHSGGFCPTQNIQDYKKRMNAEKMIEIGLNELTHLRNDCMEAQKAAKSATFSFAWNAISMGLQAFASMHSINTLGSMAAESAVAWNQGICVAQMAASLGHLALAGCNAYSWSQWNDLIHQIEEKSKRLQKTKEAFDILMKKELYQQTF